MAEPFIKGSWEAEQHPRSHFWDAANVESEISFLPSLVLISCAFWCPLLRKRRHSVALSNVPLDESHHSRSLRTMDLSLRKSAHLMKQARRQWKLDPSRARLGSSMWDNKGMKGVRGTQLVKPLQRMCLVLHSEFPLRILLYKAPEMGNLMKLISSRAEASCTSLLA